MSGTEIEYAQSCRGHDLDTSLISEERDQPPHREDEITDPGISTQTPSAQFLEHTCGSVIADQIQLQDSLDDEFWNPEIMSSAGPSSSCVPCLPFSRRGSVATDRNLSQENAASLSNEISTALSLLSNASWEMNIPSTGSDFGHPNLAANLPKIGTRFSRESSKLLTQWFENHNNYPYPSKEETETLQDQTGLSKTQIKNWLANTRRREKMHQSTQSSRKATTGLNSNKVPIDIPRRPDTPTVRTKNDQAMGPLERWVDSPPESEPATVTAIVKAVQHATSSRNELLSKAIDDESSHSINESSDNSYGISSGSSLTSIYSHGSSDSFTALPVAMRGKSRRRKRRLLPRPRRSIMGNKRHAFQCTFCAESFKTKYDWQRHEKSFHIPLERWMCSPDGPRAINSETGQLVCVFCGKSEPTDGHIHSHNPNSCQERIFNREDHLKQHLHLVHKSKLADAVTEGWKTFTRIIRSRCGFCGVYLDSWDDRVEHLAEHFKMGKTMSNWTGDWGFEDAVIDTLENAIPPYLLGEERNSPFPFEASDISPESPRTAYELLVVELSCFVETYQDKTGQIPSNDAMQLEACRIIFASEILSLEVDAQPSWLRDLVLSNEIITTQAQFLPIRAPSEGRLRTLEIRGKKTLFEECPLEAQLHNFVLSEAMVTQPTISNAILLAEACKILRQMQQDLRLSLSDMVYTWFMTLIQSSSTDWLCQFRQRAYLPIAQSSSSFTSPLLNEHWTPRTTSGTIPDYPFSSKASTFGEEIFIDERVNSRTTAGFGSGVSQQAPPLNQADFGLQKQNDVVQMGAYRLHDPNFYKWLGRELGRWVTSIMSPNNPNCHIPSDKEIQHHARFLMYDDDDPWNQTVADNPEWLHRFKVGVGIVKE